MIKNMRLNNRFCKFKVVLLIFLLIFVFTSSFAFSQNKVKKQSISIDLTEEERKYRRDNPVITVTNEFDWPPFDFAVSGKPMGFGIDLMNLLGQKSGFTMKYVNGYTWDELVDMFFKGKLDLIHSLSITPERKKKALFSTPYYHSKNVLIFRRDSIGINRLKDLEGKIISLPKGWSSIGFFKKYYPKVHIVEVESSRQALEYVDLGKVAATVEQEGIAGYFIKKFGYSDLKMSRWIKNQELQKTSSMHFAVLKKNRTLFKILEKALSSITPEEMVTLEQKWFGKTGMEIGQEDVGLTPEERKFLKEKKEISYSLSPDRMPFEAVKNGRVDGMTSDFIELFSRKLSIPFRHYPSDSWHQALEFVKNGKSDILTLVNKTESKTGTLDFTSSYLNYGVVIIVKEDSPFISGINDLSKKNVGVVEGTDIWEMSHERFPNIPFKTRKNAKQCLLDVSSDKIDAALLSLPVASHYIRTLGLTNLKIAAQTKINERLRIGVKKENKILHSIMSKLVRSLTKKEIDTIYKKWVVLKFDHKFDYSILWKYLSIGSVILIIFILWILKLVKLNKEIANANNKLEEKGQELEKISITDSLTGIYNRRFLEKTIESELLRTERYNHKICIILIDIDNFKTINDTLGHQVGDEVLRKFAMVLQNNIRKTDTLGRWGGEEFLVICPEATAGKAVVLAEKLRTTIEQTSFGDAGKRTASFGVSEYLEEDTKESLISKADKGLYRAKKNGRNRVEVI